MSREERKEERKEQEEENENIVAEVLLKFLRGFASALQEYPNFKEEDRKEILRIAETFDRRMLQVLRVTYEEFDINEESMGKFCVGAFLGVTGRLAYLVRNRKLGVEEVMRLMEFYVRLIGNCAGDVRVTTVELPKSFSSFDGEGKEVV